MKKNSIVVYPAIFQSEGDFYNVKFPDVPEAVTFGEGINESVEMAQDALGLAIYDKNVVPGATNPKDIILEDANSFVLMITLDLNEYRRKNHSKTVRKNTSIPEWLNVLAEEQNINFSQTLTEALKEKLSV